MGPRLMLVTLLLAGSPAVADGDDDAAPVGLRAGWLPLGAGLVAAATGALMLWQARVQYDLLTNPALPAPGADGGVAAAGTGRVYQAGGFTALGLGVAGIAAGTLWLVWPRAPVELVPSLGPGGPGVLLAGRFP